ncbi:hypothetical protein [Helicobacter felis]|uniref:hypothetical protein n=1 Tax=Helicobacter felis TaxID=214 RepID=UPI000CF1AF14|nr:hypothetical protein [Helicobacter felis]
MPVLGARGHAGVRWLARAGGDTGKGKGFNPLRLRGFGALGRIKARKTLLNAFEGWKAWGGSLVVLARSVGTLGGKNGGFFTHAPHTRTAHTLPSLCRRGGLRVERGGLLPPTPASLHRPKATGNQSQF